MMGMELLVAFTLALATFVTGLFIKSAVDNATMLFELHQEGELEMWHILAALAITVLFGLAFVISIESVHAMNSVVNLDEHPFAVIGGLLIGATANLLVFWRG